MPDDYDVMSVKDISSFGTLSDNAVAKNEERKERKRERNPHFEKKPKDYFRTIAKAAERSNEKLIEKNLQTGWGRFNVKLSGKHPMFRLIEYMMNLRSCVTSVATGDQAIYVINKLFKQVGGYADIDLMEDIELSKRLRKQGSAACIKIPVITSSRRWEHYGIFRTIWMMWLLRLRYFLGASPSKLNQYYRKSSND